MLNHSHCITNRDKAPGSPFIKNISSPDLKKGAIRVFNFKSAGVLCTCHVYGVKINQFQEKKGIFLFCVCYSVSFMFDICLLSKLEWKVLNTHLGCVLLPGFAVRVESLFQKSVVMATYSTLFESPLPPLHPLDKV